MIDETHSRRGATVVMWLAVAAVIALLFATPLQAAEPTKPTLGDALDICRGFLFGDTAKATAALEALPTETYKQQVDLFCTFYGQGAKDMLDVIRSEAAKADAQGRIS